MIDIEIGALTKVASNKKNYVMPDHVSKSGYSKLTGFNQEDWLCRAGSKKSDALMFTDNPTPLFKNDGVQTYSHLPGLLRSNIGIETFNPESRFGNLALICNNEIIGFFMKITTMNRNHAKVAFDFFDKKSYVGPTRESEAGGNVNAWSANLKTPENIINVRYNPDDIILFEKPISLRSINWKATGGIIVVKHEGYSLHIKEKVLTNASRANWNKLFV